MDWLDFIVYQHDSLLGVSESHFEIHKMSLLLFRGYFEHSVRFCGHNHGASWDLKKLKIIIKCFQPFWKIAQMFQNGDCVLLVSSQNALVLLRSTLDSFVVIVLHQKCVSWHRSMLFRTMSCFQWNHHSRWNCLERYLGHYRKFLNVEWSKTRPISPPPPNFN